MNQIYVGLGSNIGDSPAILSKAIKALSTLTKIGKISSLYRSEPQDYKDQADFYNVVVEIFSDISPQSLILETQKIENQAGRVKGIAKGPRVLDIDLLCYGSITLESENLHIPHTAIQNRRFVLEPLLEIAPTIKIPGLNFDLFARVQMLQEQGIYAIHPLLYNHADIWTSTHWNLEQNLIRPQVTDFSSRTSKGPSIFYSS